MQHHITDKGYVLRLAKGEELISSLVKFCEEQGIKNAVFQGIGAVGPVEIGYYNLASKEYFFRHEEGEFEVASMQGNITLVDGKPFVHAHAVLSRCDETLECFGAHFKEAYIAVTLEIFMTVLDSSIERKMDDAIGLKLLNI